MMKRLGHIALFMVTLFAFYVVAIGVATFLRVDGRSVVERLVNVDLRPGVNSYTLARFREVNQYQGADVLLLGSSHAEHGFDVRVFREAGLTAFNIGTPSQTPTASYYILKRYWNRIDPSCLVVLEVYPSHIAMDWNMGAVADMGASTPPSWHTVQLALAEKNFAALNMLLSAYWMQLSTPLSQVEQRKAEGYEYVSGGYVPMPDTIAAIDTSVYDPRWEIVEQQAKYLRRTIRFVKKKGLPIVLVTHPLPEEMRQTIENYDAVVDHIRTTAEEEGVPYLDFNKILSFETGTHFGDTNHLNAAGAWIFTRAMLQELKELGFSCLDDARPEQVAQMPEEGATTVRSQ